MNYLSASMIQLSSPNPTSEYMSLLGNNLDLNYNRPDGGQYYSGGGRDHALETRSQRALRIHICSYSNPLLWGLTHGPRGTTLILFMDSTLGDLTISQKVSFLKDFITSHIAAVVTKPPPCETLRGKWYANQSMYHVLLTGKHIIKLNFFVVRTHNLRATLLTNF